MLHKNSLIGDNHVAHNWEYADAAARTAATGFVAADLKKMALQLDNNTLWVLTATTPTWVQIGGTSLAGTVTGAIIGADYALSAMMLKDMGYTVVAKGNISAATVTFDLTGGAVQTYTATGSTVTWATSNWPPTGNLGELLVIGTNMGAFTHTITGITWLKPDGTTTTTLATYLAANTGRTAFQTSGIDQIALWSLDAGTTIYGKLV